MLRYQPLVVLLSKGGVMLRDSPLELVLAPRLDCVALGLLRYASLHGGR
jgi:hypothetical protein